MWSSGAGRRVAAAAAHEEADLDGMRNGQVAERGRIGMGTRMRGARGPAHVQQGRAGNGRQVRLPTGQERTCLTVGMYLESERTRPVAFGGPPSPGSHQQ
jgi:hypothetical protein